jgi:hypothetical protein
MPARNEPYVTLAQRDSSPASKAASRYARSSASRDGAGLA